MKCGAFLYAAILMASAVTAADLWRTSTDGDPWTLEATGDIDGDGRADVLAGAADNLFRAMSGTDGTVLWSVPTEGDVWSVTSFPDIDGDGRPEAVAGTSNNEVLVVSASGSVLWRQPTSGDVWSLAPVGDTTGDGLTELACGAGDNLVRLLDLRTRSVKWSRDVGGDVWSVAGGADFNADGIGDVVAGTAANTVVALNGVTGVVLWSLDLMTGLAGDVWRVVVGDDVDQDGVKDIVVGTASDRIICIGGKPPQAGHGGSQIVWQSTAGSDVRVVFLAPDYTGDGIREVVAGGSDDRLRLINGATGVNLWEVPTLGEVRDGHVGSDLNEDGRADIVFCTEGSTVHTASAADGAALWTYYAEVTATFWSVASLPDIDGDGVADLAAGSALNVVFGLPGGFKYPPDSVSDFACVATQTETGPAALLTWIDPLNAQRILVTEVTGGVVTPIAEVAPGVQRLLVPVSDAADPRSYQATVVFPVGESLPETCTVTMAPPPVSDLLCSLALDGSAFAMWTPPDPAGRALDGIRVVLDGVPAALLPATATSFATGSLATGAHALVVRTVWEFWESPDYTCTLLVEAVPLEGVHAFACVAAQTPAGPGALFTWNDPVGVERVRIVDTTGGVITVLGEVPAGAERLLVPIAGTSDPRVCEATAISATETSPSVTCTVTMSPPPVADVLCGVGEDGVGFAVWTSPDPGARVLDGIRVVLDGVPGALLPSTAVSTTFGALAVGAHTVVVRTVWAPWESPDFTCTLEVDDTPPEAVRNLACAPAQAATGPGVLLVWDDPPGVGLVRVVDTTGGAATVLGEVPPGAEQLLVAVAVTADARTFDVIALSPAGAGPAATCSVTMTPPPVTDLTCGVGTDGVAFAAWMPPGLRVIDGIRVTLDGAALQSLPATATRVPFPGLTEGTHTVRVQTLWGPWESAASECALFVEPPSDDVPFIRADSNGDGQVDISDAVRTLGYLFAGKTSTCLAAMDSNGEGKVDISDAIFTLGYLFAHGRTPPAPFPNCGIAPGAACISFTECAP